MKKLLYTIAIAITIVACKNDSDTESRVISQQAEIDWTLESITTGETPSSTVTWNIKNVSGSTWTPGSYSLHFNQIAGGPIIDSIPSNVKFANPGGEYIEVFFPVDTVHSGDMISLNYQHHGHIERMSNIPQGVFMRINDHTYDIPNIRIHGVNHETLKDLNPTDAKQRYAEARDIPQQAHSEVVKILPLPTQMVLSDHEHFNLASGTSISFPDEVSDDQRQAIMDHLSHYVSVVQSSGDKGAITSSIRPELGQEQYELSITSDNISIGAGGTAGIFYAFQSLAQLINPNHQDDIKIPTGSIQDQPRFGYRGFMLDVSRNFHKKDKVLQVLDLMSRYKLNKFHFHLMDDEGWRLEIPDLPELTEVGGTRGYTPDESDRLRPAYGSGGIAEDSYSTGYYTRADYIEILQYAAARHIEVIPEIDLPGHARAAIISMRARYNRLLAAGKEKEAEEYLLHDPEDESKYSSAQNYDDNVINLCRESSYTFIEKVLRETVKMHEVAGVPLRVLHTGGDEVPYGAWQKSPMCQSFLSEMENLNGTDDLHPNMLYFIRGILNEYDVVTAGWEEIVLAHTADGHNGTDINEELVGEPMLPYVWNASWGWGREDMAYKLANAGFDAVMCKSASYYFDLAYDSDPREGGLDWSGLTNAKTAFDLEPLDVMAKATHDLLGNPLDPAYIKSKDKLTESGKQRILGIQAQLWSETLYNADLVDYMIFPKIFGLAQRAWSPSTTDYTTEYHDFVNTIGQRELLRLDSYNDDGIQYRIPPPGINRNGEIIEMNILYPGLEIRYTIDGSEPTKQSSLYAGPIKYSIGTVIKAKAYNTIGRGSRVSTIN